MKDTEPEYEKSISFFQDSWAETPNKSSEYRTMRPRYLRMDQEIPKGTSMFAAYVRELPVVILTLSC